MSFQNDRVKLNVGGKAFETTSITLANAGRNSMLGAMVDDTWDAPLLENNNDNDARHHFLDRNPDCFAVILDLLRTGELHIPANLPERLLYREALYYGLLDRVRAAKWGPFDGNRLKLSRSISNRTLSYGTAIRSSPNGGCCVAHGRMVHVYDWLMDEHPPVNLDRQEVNDICWVDSNNFFVAVRNGGMGLFNSSSGELRKKFEVCHEGQVRSYTARALCFNRDNKILSSCKGSKNERGIGVWDLETGQQVDFFYEPNGWSLGGARRLQWLEDCNSLFASSFYVKHSYCYISLLDFRDKKMAWSWSDGPQSSVKDSHRRLCDAVVMEDNRSICVADLFSRGGLGFLDLRSTTATTAGIKWISSDGYPSISKKHSRPKLALHGGNLFSSFEDCISVFCVSDWVLTSKLTRSSEDSICDISIGGDRLFALHQEKNVFDIWETPTPPIS